MLTGSNCRRSDEPKLEAVIYRFGIFDFEVDSGQLRKNARPLSLERQPARVLAVLLARAGELRAVPKAILGYLVLPLMVVGIVWLTMRFNPPMPVRIVLALLLIMPISPLLDRIVFRPIADASVLLLLTVSVALHFALVGLGLLFLAPRASGPSH